MSTIGLAKALTALAVAQDAGQGHQFRFEISRAEVEFLVEVNAEGSPETGAGFGCVLMGAIWTASDSTSAS